MTKFGRGFGRRNLFQMRAFYLAYPDIVQTASAQLRLPDSKQKDSQIGKFSHADAGQMHMYLNYAREHWTHPDENPPVGLILCAEKDAAVAHYALEGLLMMFATSPRLRSR